MADRLLGLELRHLVALRTVAEEASFGRAARRLGYTQSAVSQQIATLERIVGQRLLERPRGTRRVELTDAGKLVLRHADAVTARLSALDADLEALADGSAGTLRIGIFQSVGTRVVPPLLQRFRGEWPQVDVRLTASPEDELLALVEQGELDLAFCTLPLPEGPFACVELLADAVVLVVPAGSEQARDAPASLDELATLPLIGFERCFWMDQFEHHLRAQGIEPRVVFRSHDNGIVQSLVAAGMGVAAVPRLTVDEGDERVAVVELGDAAPPRRVALVWHRDRYRLPAAQAFVEAAVELCAGTGQGARPPLAAA